MKKLALFTLMTAFASLASAGACSGGSANAGYLLFIAGVTPIPGSTSVSCAVTAPVNTYITSVTVFTISDLTNPNNNPSFDITTSGFGTAYTGTTNGVLSVLTPSPVTVTGAAQVVSSGGLSGNTDQSLTAVTLTFTSTSAKTSGFTGTANGTSIDASGIFGVSGNANGVQSGVFFTYAPVRQSGVPEPATLSMVGGALVAISLLSRRRK